MVGYKKVTQTLGYSCNGCAFKNILGNGCSVKPNGAPPPCEYDNVIFVKDDFGLVEKEELITGEWKTDDQPQIKLISALDINLVDGVLQELTDICEEQGSRIRPSSGESIRDFIKRLIYNQGKDE